MLTGEEASLFRSALGLILYVSHDRPDISFATARESALANPGREIQPVDLVGVMEVNVRFPLVHRWDFNRSAGVAFIDGRASSRG